MSFDKKEKIWSGVNQPTIFNTEVSLGYLILNEFKKTPERITQVSADTGVEVTCYQMRQLSIEMAKHLQSLGLKQGDVVGIMARNSEYLAPIYFACFTLGLPINAVDPSMQESDVIDMYSKTKPKIVFCDASLARNLQNFLKKIVHINPLIYTLVDKIDSYKFAEDILSADDCEDGDFAFPELVDVANSTALILCSSGTTGSPKGICKTHSHLIHSSAALWDIETKKQEVLLNFSPLYWVSGVAFLIWGSLYGAKRVITAEIFEATLAVDICHRFQVTTHLTHPYALSKMAQLPDLKPFEHLKACMASGTTFSENLSKILEPLIPNGKVIAMYATSEGGCIAGAFKKQRFGSCGVPAPNVQIKILDEAGNHLGPNQTGEFWYKSKASFSGYFGDLAKTAESLVDGWTKSDDIGYIDDDGFLFYVDRKKEMFWYNSVDISPSKLELILDQVGGVRRSCVVGVADESGNSIIFAIVEKESNYDGLSAIEIENFVNERVSDAEKLRGGVHFIDQMPSTPSGKAKRSEVKKIAEKICRSKGSIFDIGTERHF